MFQSNSQHALKGFKHMFNMLLMILCSGAFLYVCCGYLLIWFGALSLLHWVERQCGKKIYCTALSLSLTGSAVRKIYCTELPHF